MNVYPRRDYIRSLHTLPLIHAVIRFDDNVFVRLISTAVALDFMPHQRVFGEYDGAECEIGVSVARLLRFKHLRGEFA